MIACDLDETLLSSDSSISCENLKAIKKLAEKGVNFVIATGRALTEIPKQIDIPEIRYVIFSTGAAVLDKKTGETTYFAMPDETSSRIANVFSEYQSYTAWHQNGLFFGEPENLKKFEEYNVAKSVCKTLREVAIFKGKITSFDNIESFCIFLKSEEEKLICKNELEKIPGISVVETWPYCIEVMSKSAGKDNAAKFVAEKNRCHS